MIEQWKDIIGFEKLYQISNLGNVKSLKREYTCGKGRKKNTSKYSTSYLSSEIISGI